MFSKENDGERVMNSKSDSIENMINDKENEDMEESFELHFFLDIKLDWKHQ